MQARVNSLGLATLSKRPFPHADRLYPVRQVICQHGHAVCGVVVDVFHGEAEAGHLIHRLPVIIVPAIIAAEIEAPNRRRVLLNAGQLGHIGRCLLMAHVDAVLVLLPEDAVHIVAILIATVVGLGTPHLYLVLQDLRHHPWLGVGLIAAVENPVMDIYIMAIHISNGHTQAIAAAPGYVIDKADVVRLSVRQHSIIIVQAIRGERKPLFFYAVLHEQALKIRAVDGGLDVPDFFGRISVSVVILKITHFILIPDRNGNEATARIVPMVCLHATYQVIGVPPDCSCK